jgi:hypothetical protein
MFFSATVSAETWTVPDDFPTIQAALNSVNDYDLIQVQPGVYTENLVWPNKEGIKLVSYSGSESTIISGGNEGRVLNITGLIGRDTLIEGFTFQDGFVNAEAPFSIDSYGGGIYLSVASPTIRNCTVKNCRAQGLYQTSLAYGGGIFCAEGSPVIENCIITNNSVYAPSEAAGGGICIFVSPGLTTITNCLIENNDAFNYGDGVFIAGTTYFANNIVNSNSGDGITIIEDSIVVNNTVVGHPYIGIWHEHCYNIYLNNIMAFNRFGIREEWEINSAAGWNLYWNNEENYLTMDPGTNDLIANPQLGNDLHLTEGSPAIDSGVSSFIDDFDYDERPYGDGFDRGADEYYPPGINSSLPETKQSALSSIVRTIPRDHALKIEEISGEFTFVTIVVPDDYSTIQAALDHAEPGDDIIVKPGIYNENLVWPGIGNIGLLSEQGPEQTIINGNMGDRVIDARTQNGRSGEISGFTLRNGFTPGDKFPGGAGLLICSPHWKIRNCIFENNQVDNENDKGTGGALLITKAARRAYIENSTFINNRVNGSSLGGGSAIGILFDVEGVNPIFGASSATDITRCIITGNLSDPGGFAVYSEMPFVFTGNMISDNQSGGIYANTQGAIVIANTFHANSGAAFFSEAVYPGVLFSNIFQYHSVAVSSTQLPSGRNLYWNNIVNLTGLEHGTDDLFTNSMLDDDLVPYLGSPVIDFGITSGLETDVFGSERPLGSSYDIGAVEFDSSNPGPTPTPTPNFEKDLGIEFVIPSLPVMTGDRFYLNVRSFNRGEIRVNYPLFVMLNVADSFWFYPSWQTNLDYKDHTFWKGVYEYSIIPEFYWPENTGSGQADFWAVITNPELSEISSTVAHSQLVWGE